DDGTGCSMTKEGTVVTITCGENSTTIDVGQGSGSGSSEIAPLDSEKIAVSLDEVSGVTQKGPFLMGSKVLVREMEDGRTLTQTGNSFNGKILNDNGEFKINARMLVSQYVMLEATGYYRNEVTGQNSSSELTLFAITDVNDRNIVNVNLLTHLEYERVVYLVTQKKMKVRAAKKQAQKEVFGLFGIDATDFSNSEDLNIAGASDEDGALLAFSLMFQGDRSVADLTALLQTVANDMEKDGTWDDATTRMKIAEWSADADSAGRLATIRNNVRGWNLSSTVPNFEQYVRAFWYKEYGLDSCTVDSVGRVKAATAGKQEGTRTRYVCRDSRWQIAGDFEKDIYNWKDSTDGALKNGSVTGTKYVFDSTGSYNGSMGWRIANDVEQLYGGCRKAVYGEIRRDTYNGGFYQCQKASHRWELVNNNLLIDTQQWTEGEDGYAKWGDSIGVVTYGNKICYVYDTSAAYNGWRKGNDNDCTLGLMGCTAGRAGRMNEATDGNFYNCANNIWTKVSDRVQYNTIGWACLDSNAGEMKLGLYNTSVYFVCDENAWREATTNEELTCKNDGLCEACTEARQGAFWKHEGNQLVCDEKTWRTPNCAEAKMESLCTANDSAVVWECEDAPGGKFKVDYVCSHDPWQEYKLVWHQIRHPFEYTLENWNKKMAEFYTAKKHPDANYGDDLIDKRDENVYKTVYINGLRWMAENLRYADSNATVNLKGQSYCFGRSCKLSNDLDNSKCELIYHEDKKNCEIGGRFYSWTAAMDMDSKWLNENAQSLVEDSHQGICPNGWHIPNVTEWRILNNKGRNSLMATGFHYSAYNHDDYGDYTDALGFSVFPLGRLGLDWNWNVNLDGFYDGGDGAFFWSTKYKNGTRITTPFYDIYGAQGSDKFSVRCVENYKPQFVDLNSLTDKQKNEKKKEYYSSIYHPQATYGDDLVDKRDGNVYKTVFINGKRWMAEDLRYQDKKLADYIDAVRRSDDRFDTLHVSYSWRATNLLDSHDTTNLELCPSGWHIPDTTEWNTVLQKAKSSSDLMVNKLLFDWWNASDEFGFSVFPEKESFGRWWAEYLSSNVSKNGDFYKGSLIVIKPEITEITNYDIDIYEHYSVRCVEDDPVEP
ncbi:FISUMP domain-containing protein, partial [Fibrobacter sp.]|uniref:FISUMP domain-containing protein n=1 Tax=Fibrobacter sp. TaxID=35828 RepID=UPI0025BA70DF